MVNSNFVTYEPLAKGSYEKYLQVFSLDELSYIVNDISLRREKQEELFAKEYLLIKIHRI